MSYRKTPAYLAVFGLLGTAAFAQSNVTPPEGEVLELSPFEVNATLDRGYRATNSIGGTKTNTPIRELPLTINVITGAFLQDIAAQGFGDALRYLSGVSVINDQGSSGAAFQNMRGLRSNFFLRNGLRRYRAPSVDNIERIEIVRGSAGIIYGETDPGGAINYITKVPVLDRQSGYVEQVVGQYSNFKTVVDHNQPIIDGMLAARMVVAYTNRDFRRDHASQEQTMFAPSLAFRPFSSTRITVAAEFDKRSDSNFLSNGLNGAYNLVDSSTIPELASFPRQLVVVGGRPSIEQGNPSATGHRPIGILPIALTDPYSFNQTGEMGVYSDYEKRNFSATLEQALARDLSFADTVDLRVSFDYTDDKVVNMSAFFNDNQGRSILNNTPGGVGLWNLQIRPDGTPNFAGAAAAAAGPRARPYLLNTTTVNSPLNSGIAQNTDHTITTDVLFRSTFGNVRSNLLIGHEYRYAEFPGFVNYATGAWPDTVPVSPTNAFFGFQTYDYATRRTVRTVDAANPKPSDPQTFAERRNGDMQRRWMNSFYVTEHLSLMDERLRLLGAVRYAEIKRQQATGSGAGRTYRNETFDPVTPQFGVNYSLTPGLTLFASHNVSFNITNARAPGINDDPDYPPEEGVGTEAGLKFNLVDDRLVGTFTVFSLARENIGVFDPALPNPRAPSGFGRTVYNGKEESEGVELELFARPFEGMDVIANVTLLDSIMRGTPTQPWLEGKAMRGVAKETGSVWGKYTFPSDSLRGWSFGAGAIYTGKRPAGQPNDATWAFDHDATLTWDAMVGWERRLKKGRLAVQLNVKNLGDELVLISNSIPQGQGREFVLTARWSY